MTGPLAEIRVLEFSQAIAGPHCGVNLADLGADVVKVEPPDGGGSRNRRSPVPGETKSFHTLNRGKRSLVLDLKQPAAQEMVHRIVPRFDVVTSNMTPGATKRLRIDYETLLRFRPDLIYAQNTGFGTRGPNATRTGSDVVAQAYSGLMAAEVKFNELGGPDLIQCTGIVDFPAGVVMAMGICAALFHRERTGEGQYVTTNLLTTAMSMMGRDIARSPVLDAVARDPMMERIQAVRDRGGTYQEVVQERGGMYDLLGHQSKLYYGGYAVKDGAIMLGALTPKNREHIRTLVGLDHDPTNDPDFDTMDPANRPIIDGAWHKISEAMRTRTMDEWIADFDRLGVPASKVLLAEELSDDEHVVAAGMMIEVEHELVGRESFVGPLVGMSAAPTGSTRPSPPLGRHSEDVLLECGASADEVAALRDGGALG